MTTRSDDDAKAIANPLPPPIPEGWTRCHAYLSKKRRYCRQLPIAREKYCGNHRELISVSGRAAESEGPSKSKRARKRIPCPLDGSHFIYEDALARHLRVCPKARLQREQERQPYYRPNVNGGGHGAATAPSSGGARKLLSLDQAKTLALRVLHVHQQLFTGASPQSVRHLTLEEIEAALPLRDLSSPELAGLGEAVESYRIRSGGPKHLHQQASLLGHLRQHAASDRDQTLLELGAGRGMLGLVAAGALAAADRNDKRVDLIMVERSGTRAKADTVLRNHTSTAGHLRRKCLRIERVRRWSRIQCDVAHVCMPVVLNSAAATKSHGCVPVVPAVASNAATAPSNGNVLAVAKHLCGAGTDLALKALFPVRDQLQVCMMATCCHGLCTWEHYVGRDYLRRVLVAGGGRGGPVQVPGICDESREALFPVEAFGPDEFEALRLWSAGTAIGADHRNKMTAPPDRKKSKVKEDGEDHKPAIPSLPQTINITTVVSALDLACGVQGLGRACQRLLDYGRQQYMDRDLFANNGDSNEHKVDLCYYVPPTVTPQNAVLIASRQCLADP